MVFSDEYEFTTKGKTEIEMIECRKGKRYEGN